MITISNSSSNLKLQNYMTTFAKNKQEAMERLASGYKVSSASDNAGGYSVAINATTQLRGLEVSNQNATVAKDVLDIADESLVKITELANTIQSLSKRALDGTADERASLQEEANGLIEEMRSLKNNTKYNDVEVFRSEGFIFQVGYEGNADSGLIANTSLEADQLSGFDIDNYTVDFSDDDKIKAEMEKFDALQGDLNKKTVELGAKNQMLQNVIETQEKIYTEVNENRGNIVNTDVAAELVKYVKSEILYSATEALNQQTYGLNSSLVLGLLGI